MKINEHRMRNIISCVLMLILILSILLSTVSFIQEYLYYSKEVSDIYTGTILAYEDTADGIIVTVEVDSSGQNKTLKLLADGNEFPEGETYGKIIFDNKITGVYAVVATESYSLGESLSENFLFPIKTIIVWPFEWNRLVEEGIISPEQFE